MPEAEKPYLSLKSYGDDTRAKPCDASGCPHAGLHRAPKGPDRLDDHYWFCRDHARDYNAAWDYFKGKTMAEIDHFRYDVACWHRPTWRIAGNGRVAEFFDPLGILNDAGVDFDHRRRYAGEDITALSAADRKALKTLELDQTANQSEIKRAYKRLVKRYHPDANGGDRATEEALVKVNAAYRHLAAAWRKD